MEIAETTLRAAAFRFEQDNGNTLGDLEADEIRKASLDKHQVSEVAQAVREFAENASADDPSFGPALWALGKRSDHGLKGLFTRMLRKALDVDPNATYQALIALDNLGEDVLLDGGSSLNHERIRRLAEAYLAEQNT